MRAWVLALAFSGLSASSGADVTRPNGLAGESSPYLQQHAHDPVDWQPWGEAAFAKARLESKPIFLSIGFSTCHWCHVLARESFADPAIGALINANFVAIMVDREERPEIDRIYTDAASIAGWDAGWPLNVWMTPELKPFFAGTYFPPDSRDGQMGLKPILAHLDDLWRTRRADVLADSAQIAKTLSAPLEANAKLPGPAALDAAFEAFRRALRPEGGFNGPPKFPMPAYQSFLLRYYARTEKAEAREMAVHTLRRISQGAIHDQLGGGFHRYATEERWGAPHLEKMLYDNAQLAVNFIEAYQASGEPQLAATARATLDYMLRDLAHPAGGFYCAEDAESGFYRWNKREILALLGEKQGEIASYRYGVEGEGALLYDAKTVAQTALRFKMPEAEAGGALESSAARLLEARSARARPSRDEKILASWNGLAISALARGAQALADPRYLLAAEKSARFLRANLYDPSHNRLYRVWRSGERKMPGLAEDYALTAAGLLDLYETSFDVQWLDWSIRLTEAQLELFYDAEQGGFYSVARDFGQELLVRPMEDSDQALPAASSTAALNLLRLSELTDRSDFRRAAERTLSRFGRPLAGRPQTLAAMLAAVDFHSAQPRRVVIAGAPGASDTLALIKEVHRRFIPNAVSQLKPMPGRATAHVCRAKTCGLPTADPKALGRILDERTSTSSLPRRKS